MSAIRDIFNEGKFKTPVAVETSHVKWVMHTGDVPVPRPGAVSLKTLDIKAYEAKSESEKIHNSDFYFVFPVHQ